MLTALSGKVRAAPLVTFFLKWCLWCSDKLCALPNSGHHFNEFFSLAKDNLNISEAANFLVKHIMATENDILKTVVPDTISPLDDPNRQSCSGCFK